MQGGEKRIGEAMERTRCCIAMCESGERKEKKRRRKRRLRKKRKEERGMKRRRKKRERKEGGGKKKKKKKKKRRTILWIVLFEKEQLFSVFLRVCYIQRERGSVEQHYRYGVRGNSVIVDSYSNPFKKLPDFA